MLIRDYSEPIDFNWQKDAACKGMPIDWFYVGRGQMVSASVVEACERCPVKEACLTHALKHEDHGYWGGTSEKQRSLMRIELGIRLRKPESGIYNFNTLDTSEVAIKERLRQKEIRRKKKEQLVVNV